MSQSLRRYSRKNVQKGVSELPLLQLMKLSDRNYNIIIIKLDTNTKLQVNIKHFYFGYKNKIVYNNVVNNPEIIIYEITQIKKLIF